MTPTRPGSVVMQLGNASGTTIVDMQDPGREYDSVPEPAPAPPPPPRVKRKYQRRHLDKQRHEAHQDKELAEHGEADEQS